MDAYTSFAQVYDLFMDNVPYEEWCARLCALLRGAGITEGTVVELGCGTGKMTRRMARAGYDMIGIDNSLDMLEIAGSAGGRETVLYLMQDMAELELSGPVAAVYSVCDSVNYLLETGAMERMFARVFHFLLPGGCFLFDMNTPYKYRELLGENVFAENRSEGSFIWENYFDEAKQVNEYGLTLFIREDSGLFARYEEVHLQRCYGIGEVKEMLRRTGFELIGIYDGYREAALADDSSRALFALRRPN